MGNVWLAESSQKPTALLKVTVVTTVNSAVHCWAMKSCVAGTEQPEANRLAGGHHCNRCFSHQRHGIVCVLVRVRVCVSDIGLLRDCQSHFQ